MASKALKLKIARVLRSRGFGDRGDRVHVFDGDSHDHVHVLIVSPKFAGKHLGEKGDLIWSILFQHLAQDEWGKITLTQSCTPQEVDGLSVKELRLRI